jgi:predicted CXXCH cytochrome family protein
MLLAVALLAIAGNAGGATAQTTAQTAVPKQITPLPAIPRGQGQSCVAPTDWMRRYHMTVLTHQRDKTVHDGVRAGPFDLKGCIACHAVPGTDGKPVTVSDPKHFCRGCHDYAAVSVDCFQCHASRPDLPQKSSASPAAGDVAALAAYLEGARP